MRRALPMAWILAPLLVAAIAAVAHADDENSDDTDDADEPGESPVDPDEAPVAPAQTFTPPMGEGMDGQNMGHTPSMRSNPAINEIKAAHGGEAPTHNPKPTSGRTDLTPARDQLFRALSKRSEAPECSMAEGIADDPVSDFTWLVDHVAMPPWVGLRAADCLITDFSADAAAGEAMMRWVVEPGSAGVGLLVLDRIDDLPEDLAVKVAEKAVSEGPDPKEARKRVKESTRESVRKAYK